MTWLWLAVGSLGLVLTLFMLWGAILTLRQQRQIKTAIPAFFPQREHLEARADSYTRRPHGHRQVQLDS